MHNLLGRDVPQVDVDGAWLTGWVVLITGAGGSIGSELARQVARWHPQRLVLFGHSETALLTVHTDIVEAGHDRGQVEVQLGDIRDRDRVARLLDGVHPNVVFHAAALKHLPVLEREPAEAVKTNVIGTLNLLDQAERRGVRVFINVSTDKAADPVSVLGTSKRITERVTAWYRNPRWVSVRFGNVLGSRGSMLATFARQIANGGPITVTHPDVDRYFMTIPHAVALTLHAGKLGRFGDALVLDMGAPVKISDIARRLSTLMVGRELPIVYTGLRPGEKLHERLLGDGDGEGFQSDHLLRVVVPPLDPRHVIDQLTGTGISDELVDTLRAIAAKDVR